jgi:hypothetical protein
MLIERTDVTRLRRYKRTKHKTASLRGAATEDELRRKVEREEPGKTGLLRWVLKAPSGAACTGWSWIACYALQRFRSVTPRRWASIWNERVIAGLTASGG